MADPASKLEAKALKLPPEKRARLAERLISSLDETADADADALWIAEAERRLQELESGATPCTEIHSDPEILGGTPVFRGTRVPVKALLDYLEGGHPLSEFLDDFPTVSRDQAVQVLEHAKELLASSAPVA